MYFSKEMRQQLKEENPDMKFGEVGKTIGNRWKVISAEEKAKYEAMAKKDKERHGREVSAYKSKKTAEKKDEQEDDDDDDDDSDGMDDHDDDDDEDSE
jgi:hypothetical protein